MKYLFHTKTLITLSLAAILFLSACDRRENYGQEKTGEGLFAGKTIEWIIPFKEGGGSDTWARFNVPFLAKYLPGRPTIFVNNLPGGGSIKGANLFAERVKPDGLMILGTSGSTQFPFLLDDPRVRYQYNDFVPIMSYPTGGVVYCSPKLGINSADELANIHLPGGKRLMYASQGPTSLDLVPLLSFDLLGMDVKAVFGFRGRGAGRLAFERGEVLIDYQTSSAYLKNVLPLVENGEAIPLFSFGALDEHGSLIRDPSFPDLPHFGEVYELLTGKGREGIEWRAWFAFMSAGFGGMKLLLVPRETPEDIIKAYQRAIVEMNQDTLYRQSKRKAIGEYEQETGTKAKRIFDLATKVSQEEKDWVKNWLRRTYDLNI